MVTLGEAPAVEAGPACVAAPPERPPPVEAAAAALRGVAPWRSPAGTAAGLRVLLPPPPAGLLYQLLVVVSAGC